MMKKSIRFKKWLSLWLALVLCFTLAACGEGAAKDKGGDGSSTTASAVTTIAGEDSTTDTSGTTTADGSSAIGGSSAADGSTATHSTTGTSQTTGQSTTATTSSADKSIVDAALALGVGESLPDDATLTGVVTYVKEVSDGYQNATFDIEVEGSNGAATIHCFRVKPADGTALEVAEGDVLTLTGTIQNYKGTIEFYPATYVNLSDGGITTTTTARPTGGSGAIDEDGIYDSKEDVALYIHTYGKLPKNYVTKSQYNKNDRYQCVGGDRFYNKEGRLPAGEIYYECDIDTYGSTSRGAKRIVWTKSGIVYYTGDHYETFTQLYGER